MKIVAVKFNHLELPALGRLKGDDFFWGVSGRSHCPLVVADRIVKEYGDVDSDDYEQLEKIEIAYIQDFPPCEGDISKDGWLSPEGRYFHCHYGEHMNLAQDIAILYSGGICDDGDKYLRERGWIVVRASAIGFDGEDEQITKKQILVLSEMLLDQKSVLMHKAINRFLKWR